MIVLSQLYYRLAWKTHFEGNCFQFFLSKGNIFAHAGKYQLFGEHYRLFSHSAIHLHGYQRLFQNLKCALTHWGRVTHFNRNSNIFIHENGFESVVCEMTAILARLQYCQMPFRFTSRILCNLRQIHSETSRFIKKTRISLSLYMSLSAQNTFSQSDLKIAAWTMLYELFFFVIHVNLYNYTLHAIHSFWRLTLNMGSHFALPVINKVCIFPTLFNEFEM